MDDHTKSDAQTHHSKKELKKIMRVKRKKKRKSHKYKDYKDSHVSIRQFH